MRHNKLPVFITLLNASLLLLLAFIGYHTVGKTLGAQKKPVVLKPLTVKDNASVKNKSLPSNLLLSDYKAVWERNLFNISTKTHSVPQKQINFANVAGADKKIGVKLVGTVLANVSANRFVIIENNRGQNIYQEGDTADSFVIKKIFRNKVIISTENGDILLALKSDKFEREAAVASLFQTPSKSFIPNRNGNRFKTVELPREGIIAAFDDIDRLIQETTRIIT